MCVDFEVFTWKFYNAIRISWYLYVRKIRLGIQKGRVIDVKNWTHENLLNNMNAHETYLKPIRYKPLIKQVWTSLSLNIHETGLKSLEDRRNRLNTNETGGTSFEHPWNRFEQWNPWRSPVPSKQVWIYPCITFKHPWNSLEHPWNRLGHPGLNTY